MALNLLEAGRFEDKVVVVTGAGSGIGEELAHQFGAGGARVVLAEYSDEAGARVEADLQSNGVEAFYVNTDVSDQASAQGMVEAVVDKYGGIDVLINNAGNTRDQSFLGMSREQYEQVMDVHIGGLFNVAQPVAKVMAGQESWDAIVNASSISALTGNKGQFNYTAAKGGIISATRTMALELASKKIRVNAVLPGLTETAMTKGMPDQARGMLEAGILLGRIAQPQDITPAYLFLASDEAGYITGETLTVSGGLVPPSPGIQRVLADNARAIEERDATIADLRAQIAEAYEAEASD